MNTASTLPVSSSPTLALSRGRKVLSDIICLIKYAGLLKEKHRRENWQEIVARNEEMHLKKFPQLADEIRKWYRGVYDFKFLPSMRSLQFGGKAIEANNARIYNCGYAPISDIDVFGEIMYLLLCGCGMGYSVRKHHISKLPAVVARTDVVVRYQIADSIAGWGDSVKELVRSYLVTGNTVEFDYSLIRPEGAPLVTSGGKAPGPEPLRASLENVRNILDQVVPGTQLSSLQIHDIMCHLSNAVFAGGIRRSAMIVLADPDDEEMITCKSGDWWKDNLQRSRANNTIVFLRGQATRAKFLEIWKRVQESNAGEPGIYHSNSVDDGANPCNEAALAPWTFCNLVEINADDIHTQAELEERARGATFISTLQASYTDFVYLTPRWKKATEADALIGVSMTGIASGGVMKLDLARAAEVVVEENKRVARLIGINSASRTTLNKPAGTVSLLLGTSSGLHAWHGPQYIRRVEVNKSEEIYGFFMKRAPELVEDDLFSCTQYILYVGKVSLEDGAPKITRDTDRPATLISKSDPIYSYYQKQTPELLEPVPSSATKAKLCFPVVAPEGAIYRDESALDFLERVKKINLEWIRPGHVRGSNTHNASATVSIKKDEWDAVGEWLWENRDNYNGVAVLPYDDFVYQQAPHEDCSMEKIIEMEKALEKIDISEMVEEEVHIDFIQEVSCSGEKCERPLPASALIRSTDG